MRKISAHYILTEEGHFLKYGILLLDDNGVVLGVRNQGSTMGEEEGLEFYGGILVPGFINACTFSTVFKKLSSEKRNYQLFARTLLSRGTVVLGIEEKDSDHTIDGNLKVVKVPVYDGENNVLCSNRVYCPAGEFLRRAKEISKDCPLLLIEDGNLSKDNWWQIKNIRSAENTFIVLLGNNSVRNYSMLEEIGFPICIGTGNHSTVSVWEILKETGGAESIVSLERLLIQSTINGAKALGIEREYGSFKCGARPQVNLISGVNLRMMEMGENATIHSIVQRD